jgi:tellurite resistance protein
MEADARVRLPPLVPAMFFGMVLGVGGLGNAWRVACRVWNLPVVIADVLCLAAIAIWLVWTVLFAWKWLAAPAPARAEITEPTLLFVVILVPMGAMIASLCAKPLAPELAWWMFAAGALGTFAFTIWTTGLVWQGGRPATTTTPAIYMPNVGGALVVALTAQSFGHPDIAWPMLGVGMASWLIWESVVLHRLATETMPVHQRATFGIHLTPSAVASVAYLTMTEGQPDRLSQMLLGYALLQALVMLRLWRWLGEQPFAPATWAYTFGIAALAISTATFAERGGTGILAQIAPVVFVFANVFIGAVMVRTAVLAWQGRLFPAPHPSPKVKTPA